MRHKVVIPRIERYGYPKSKSTESRPQILEIEPSLDLYRKIALSLLGKHKDEIQLDYTTQIDGIGRELKNYDRGLLRRYHGHGITKGYDFTQVMACLCLLDTHTMLGSTGRLKDSGYVDAYTSGGFLVLSRKDRELVESDKNGESRLVNLVNGTQTLHGLKINPGALIVNTRFDCLVEELRVLFPYERIFHASEIGEYLNEE